LSFGPRHFGYGAASELAMWATSYGVLPASFLPSRMSTTRSCGSPSRADSSAGVTSGCAGREQGSAEQQREQGEQRDMADSGEIESASCRSIATRLGPIRHIRMRLRPAGAMARRRRCGGQVRRAGAVVGGGRAV